jgi:hypothetical protein
VLPLGVVDRAQQLDGALGPSDAIIVPKPISPTIPSTAITGWVVTVEEVDYIQNGFFDLMAQDGSKLVDLTGNDNGLATIEQTVGLQVGKTYTLDFWIGGSNLFRNDADPAVAVGIKGLGSKPSPADGTRPTTGGSSAGHSRPCRQARRSASPAPSLMTAHAVMSVWTMSAWCQLPPVFCCSALALWVSGLPSRQRG